jgi:hypothetical protein
LLKNLAYGDECPFFLNCEPCIKIEHCNYYVEAQNDGTWIEYCLSYSEKSKYESLFKNRIINEGSHWLEYETENECLDYKDRKDKRIERDKIVHLRNTYPVSTTSPTTTTTTISMSTSGSKTTPRSIVTTIKVL